MSAAADKFEARLSEVELQRFRELSLYHDCRYQARRAIVKAKWARALGRRWAYRRWVRSARMWRDLANELPRPPAVTR